MTAIEMLVKLRSLLHKESVCHGHGDYGDEWVLGSNYHGDIDKFINQLDEFIKARWDYAE